MAQTSRYPRWLQTCKTLPPAPVAATAAAVAAACLWPPSLAAWSEVSSCCSYSVRTGMCVWNVIYAAGAQGDQRWLVALPQGADESEQNCSNDVYFWIVNISLVVPKPRNVGASTNRHNMCCMVQAW